MKRTKYTIKLFLTFIATCLFGAIFSLSNMTGSRYNARQSILAISSLNGSSQLLDNKTKPLSKFYKDLIQSVAEWKIPRGYKLTEAYFKTSSGNVDVLPIRKQDFVEVSLKGNLKFILSMVSEKKKIDCDSTTNMNLNSVNIWEVKNKIYVRIKDRKYFYMALAISGILVATLLTIKRGKTTIFICLTLGVFLALTIGKQFLKPEHYYVLRYIDISSSVSIMLILVSFYFIQSSVLSQYHEMHNMFAYQFRTYVVTMISVLLSVFNHNIVVNMINWFVWVPILQCYVFQNYEEILDREQKKKGVINVLQMVDEFEPLKLDDAESMQEYSDFHARRKKNLRPYFMFIHLMVFVVSLLVCFKNEKYFNATREVDEALSRPFEVDNMSVLDIEEFVRNKDDSSVKFKIVKTERKEVIEDISLITSKTMLKAWVNSFTKKVNFKTSLILYKDLEDKGDYKLFNEKNIERLSELNMKLLFIFGGDRIITTAEIAIGENKTSTTLKNLSVITFGLKQNMNLGVLILLNCFVLIAALVLTGGKDKSKLRPSLIIALLAINVVFCVLFFFIIPKLLKEINDGIKVLEGATEGEDLRTFVKSVTKFVWVRKGVTVILFLCIVLLIVYITISMPKEYSSFNKNMTSVKREITSDWKNLRILGYQFTILILISSIVGHEAFGYKYEEFRNGLLSLRYNLIMMFNKFLIEPKADLKNPLYLYHRFAIFVFYNVVLTGFLATFYFHSCTKRDLWFRKHKNFFVFPKSGDFNFDVNIKATFEELLAFKVFLKAFNAYKEHIKANETEKEDACKQFLETFTQSKQGINKFTFNGDIYVYFERIKRYLLCIVFLRIKINCCNAKIKRLEEERERITRQNDNKRDYLIMLQKKLKETIAEVERFRSTNTILDLIDANKNAKDDKKVKEEKPALNTMESKRYDLKELEAFLIDPNKKKKIEVEDGLEPEEEGETEKHKENKSSEKEGKQISESPKLEFKELDTGSYRNKSRKEKESSASDSITNQDVGSDSGSKSSKNKENPKKDPESEENKVNRQESKSEKKENNKENGQKNVKNEDEEECSAEKQSTESENKTKGRTTLKRPEKTKTTKKEVEEVGIFKSNVLKN
ncbi:integral membrane protein [Theileria orientalis strain Shintoku]|uniref:Integral membrane protein n=1 Tax=Theileria orientalis strain Shintoku TaxID=869250 RepID=J4C3P2_THEOR|nr:integral membrane protein [Theileria orientalis strain Shintoku]BAM40786.1 integral membrane protein [Theileria orientalis strain Shintoku]|eukprot:XP_009691087.1 integral membrane protein [Theileria orientalis strain Shintoku]